jgi:hypothetical protein
MLSASRFSKSARRQSCAGCWLNAIGARRFKSRRQPGLTANIEIIDRVIARRMGS